MFLFIERLIQFLILLSILRTVLRFVGGLRSGLGRKNMQPPSPQSNAPSGADSRGGADTRATALQPDPVCGTYVSVESSLKKIVNGKVYHFCSPECRDKFTA